uniref:Uncharacterized protein n=1 Tax=Arundo donax TaxID=35708 RepID=A0A0A9EFA3_ARUDO
MTSFGSSRM